MIHIFPFTNIREKIKEVGREFKKNIEIVIYAIC